MGEDREKSMGERLKEVTLRDYVDSLDIINTISLLIEELREKQVVVDVLAVQRCICDIKGELSKYLGKKTVNC